MALTLNLDSFDFSSMVRLQPGEGFDPAANPRDPIFSGDAAGEGQPILGFSEQNKMLQWPLHLTPLKTADADTKDGLHALVRSVNAACRDAKRVEWKDDSATNSTFWDVQAAKFEPDHSYWKARKLYLSGVLKVWVKPYGDTGTMRVAGTAAASGVAVAVPVASFGGDVDAQVRAVLTVGSQVVPDGRIVGLAAVPSGYTWDIPLGSITALSGAAITGASGAPGSQVLRASGLINPLTVRVDTDGYADYGRFALSPASMYAGKPNRILAVARSWGGARWRAINEITGLPLENAAIASGLGAFAGFTTLDLGPLTVPDRGELATIPIRLQVQAAQINDASSGITDPLGPDRVTFGQNQQDLAKLMVFPDDQLTVISHSNRRPIAWDDGRLHTAQASGATINAQSDAFGNTYGPVDLSLASALLGSYGLHANGEDLGDFPDSAGNSRWNSLRATGTDLRTEVVGKVQPGQFRSNFQLGKQTADGAWYGFLQVGTQAGKAFGLAFANTLGSGLLVSSAAIPSAVQAIMAFNGSVAFLAHSECRGPTMMFSVEVASGQIVGTVTTGTASLQKAGVPFMSVTGASHGTFRTGVNGWRSTDVPIGSYGAADRVVFDGQQRSVLLRNNASAAVQMLDAYQRGAVPQITSGKTSHLVGLNLPLADTATNDVLSMEVRIRERFLYAQ